MSSGDSGRRDVFGFQGQGTHELGLGRDLRGIPEADAVFQEADEETERLIGTKISDIILKGTPEQLAEHSQLAIFVVSAASTAVLMKRVKRHPYGVTGHSLGEYAALLAAGTFSLKSGIHMIHERQKAMSQADDQVPGGGGMAAVTGLTEQGMTGLASKLDIDVAAVNTGSAGTLSGPRLVVEQVPDEVGNFAEGNARGRLLDINSAAHSRWNSLAAVIMKPVLGDIEFKVPDFHFFANNGQIIRHPDEIRAHLLRMFENPVRFHDISKLMADSGVKRFTEVGKNKLLSKFVQKSVGDQIDTEISSKVIEENQN